MEIFLIIYAIFMDYIGYWIIDNISELLSVCAILTCIYIFVLLVYYRQRIGYRIGVNGSIPSIHDNSVYVKRDRRSDKRKLNAYIDGVCANNGRPNARAGIGIYWKKDIFSNVSERIDGKQTNQRADLIAARRAIEIAKQNGHKAIVIYTNSEYVCKSQDWTQNWECNGWKNARGVDVTNKQDFIDLRDASQDMDVLYKKVVAREKYGSIEANRLAKHATNL